MSTFHFQPSARLQRFLGRELIADPNLAVIEFVKNAYDAGAANVFLEFHLTETPTNLIIADDGAGMNEKAFEANWMRPGYSRKAPEAPTGHRISPSETRGRVPVGEKGLGRLAAGRLGDRLDVFTRRRTREPWLHIEFDWSWFDDMTKLMDEVRIPYDFDSQPEDPLVDSGTVIVITGLQQTWDGKVRGRPVLGRSRTKLGRLKQDLRLLVRPLGPAESSFAIHIDSDSILDENDIGTIEPSSAVDDADYVYHFQFRQPKSGPTVRRSLQRSERVASQLDKEAREDLGTAKLENISKVERRPATLECGPFEGRFLYTPPAPARRAKEIEAVGHGVLLYRDGVLVEPYGLDDDDWIGVSSRKAQRQGYALVQPATFSGYVKIDRASNAELRDMSNRQGLIENEASEVFLQHVRAEFRFFEEHVFDELASRWEKPEAKAARESEESLDLAAVRLRAVAHSLGQPLMGLDADIAGIRIVARREGMPTAARDDLLALADSADQHLAQARVALGRFRSTPVAERGPVDLRSLVAGALDEVKPFAKSLGVELQSSSVPAQDVFVHEELILEALRELIRNAVEASQGIEGGRVDVFVHEEGGNPVVNIEDNGLGIPGLEPDDDLAAVESTKGRPGEGLVNADASITASRGRLRLVSTGPNGTHVQVLLPTLIGGLR